MDKVFHSYECIKLWKDEGVNTLITDTLALNSFHDEVMKSVFSLAVERISKGEPPCEFAWFVMGSGGRMEQAVVSDQDHGIVFNSTSQQSKKYFLALGKEISEGLNIVGYPLCEGNVMSSNPIWCKSIEEWKKQLFEWMKEESWHSIRNLQIFFDARKIVGQKRWIYELKTYLFEFLQTNPSILIRFSENVRYVKKSIGPLGQIIIEEKGSHVGEINLKYTAFIPYVNAIRLLAIKEGLYENSTVDRMKRLMDIPRYSQDLNKYYSDLLLLLAFRAYTIRDYDATHYLSVKKLKKTERKRLKSLLKNVKKLHQYVTELIEHGCRS